MLHPRPVCILTISIRLCFYLKTPNLSPNTSTPTFFSQKKKKNSNIFWIFQKSFMLSRSVSFVSRRTFRNHRSFFSYFVRSSDLICRNQLKRKLAVFCCKHHCEVFVLRPNVGHIVCYSLVVVMLKVYSLLCVAGCYKMYDKLSIQQCLHKVCRNYSLFYVNKWVM